MDIDISGQSYPKRCPTVMTKTKTANRLMLRMTVTILLIPDIQLFIPPKPMVFRIRETTVKTSTIAKRLIVNKFVKNSEND